MGHNNKKNQVIKLPNIGFEKSLKNFILIKDQPNFNKYKTFDYRIIRSTYLKLRNANKIS